MSAKHIIVFTSLFGAVGFTYSQQSAYFNNRDNYRNNIPENLYQEKIYRASQYKFAREYYYNNPQNAKKEAALFYDDIIGVILNQQHAEESLEAFTKEYPNSAYFALASEPLADYYLAKKDFPKALSALSNVNQYTLSKEENTQYILKLGYARFMTGDISGAVEALEEARNNATGEEKDDINYMLGHLQYAEGNTDKAFQYFDLIKDSPKFSQTIRPYYIQLYFNEKKYDDVIREGNDLLKENLSEDYANELKKIIGEAYFMKEDYQSAEPLLKSYLSKIQNPTENDLYEMGFVYTKLHNYDEAIKYYNRIINSQSPLSQNAYYQLGNAYLQVGKKSEALSAYRSASQMNFEPKVQQLAHLQYAKLGYDVGNPFESSSQVLQKYITQYPNDANTKELKNLLVKSYLHSGNYKETLDALKDIDASVAEKQKIEQEASFLLGTEEFNKGNFAKAEELFKTSLKYKINQDFNTKAQYWLGQSQYQQGDYTSSIDTFQKLYNSKADFDLKQQLPYDLAYSYFKNKNFDEAQKYFKLYLNDPKEEFRKDAELRLADTYYANNQLNDALSIYDKDDNATDYTQFQKAMSLGFKGDSQEKINVLKSLIATYKSSDYVDDAQYEIATAYAIDGKYSESNDYFTQVIKSSQDKDLVVNSLIYRAQNYADMGQEDKALKEISNIGKEYKGTSYAEKVVNVSKSIYFRNGDLDGYKKFADNLGIQLSSSEFDEINLTTAQKFYSAKKYAEAIPYYEKYLVKNPFGEKLYQAQYELGESYYQSKNNVKSLILLQEIANKPNDYQEDARVRLAQIYLNQHNPNDAKIYLAPLANSKNESIKNYAVTEMMKILTDQNDAVSAEKYADIILKNPKNSVALKEQAQLVRARSLLKRGKETEARALYLDLEKSNNPAVVAESLYSKAEYQNKAKAYKASNETIFKLADKYSSEDYWGAKSLLILAKNYIGLKDNYQATYTLDQINENYKDYPEIIAEAKKIKAQIK